jgi:hypothetical protein
MIISVSKLKARLQASDTVIAFWTCDYSTIQICRGNQIYRGEPAQKIDGALHLGSQSIGFCKTSETDGSSLKSSMPDVMMRLPAVKARGGLLMTSSDLSVKGSITVERFIGTFKPSVLEKILSVFQAAEQDIQALVSIGQSLQDVSKNPPSTPGTTPVRSRSIRYDVGVRSEGICVSLQATQVLSTLTIQTGAISGDIARDGTSTDPMWSANVTSLLLSLGHQSARGIPSSASQSASMQFSLQISQDPEEEARDESGSATVTPTTIGVQLVNVHATLQVSALSEIYDLLGSWSTDLGALRARRKEEWEKVVNKTEQLIKTDHILESPELTEDWFILKRVINVRLTGLALAVPLTLSSVLDPSASRSAALLFTVAAVEVSNQKGDSGKVEVIDVLLQFVDRWVFSELGYPTFHQPNRREFTVLIRATRHSTMACITLPGTECTCLIPLWKCEWKRARVDLFSQTARSRVSSFAWTQTSSSMPSCCRVFTKRESCRSSSLRRSILWKQRYQDSPTPMKKDHSGSMDIGLLTYNSLSTSTAVPSSFIKQPRHMMRAPYVIVDGAVKRRLRTISSYQEYRCGCVGKTCVASRRFHQATARLCKLSSLVEIFRSDGESEFH